MPSTHRHYTDAKEKITDTTRHLTDQTFQCASEYYSKWSGRDSDVFTSNNCSMSGNIMREREGKKREAEKIQ